jgi:hypothetical protein
MAKPFVLVFPDISELLHLADQNVSLALSVLRMKRATTKNVLILVLEHVASMQYVKSETTIQFVVAHQAI